MVCLWVLSVEHNQLTNKCENDTRKIDSGSSLSNWKLPFWLHTPTTKLSLFLAKQSRKKTIDFPIILCIFPIWTNRSFQRIWWGPNFLGCFIATEEYFSGCHNDKPFRSHTNNLVSTFFFPIKKRHMQDDQWQWKQTDRSPPQHCTF